MKIRSIGRKTLVLSLVAVVAISMIGIGAVVQHLSNEVNAKANVTTPQLEMKIGKENGNWASDDKITFDVYGGATIDFWIYLENLADHPIEVEDTQYHYIHCPQKFDMNEGGYITKEEFDSMTARTWSSEDGWDPSSGSYDLLSFMSKVDNKNVKVRYGQPDGYTLAANEVQKIHVTVEFDNHCTGTYKLSSQII
jgi:hypothetical protein